MKFMKAVFYIMIVANFIVIYFCIDKINSYCNFLGSEIQLIEDHMDIAPFIEGDYE